MSQRPRATIIRLVVACAPIECIYTYIIRVYIGSSRCNPLQLTEGLYYSRRWKCGKSRSKSSSLLFLFVFFLYIYIFFYLRPSNRNRIRVLQTTLLGCKRVCHVASASIRVPGAQLLSHSLYHCRSLPFFYIYLYFILLLALPLYIYIYISSPHTYYCKRTCVIFIHNMLVCVNIILI